MFNVLVITDREIGIGFKLAGVEVRELSAVSEAETLLKECLTDESYGMIVIHEDYVSHFTPRTQHIIEESTIPLIIPIPLRMKWEFEESRSNYLNDLIKRSIGYQISFR